MGAGSDYCNTTAVKLIFRQNERLNFCLCEPSKCTRQKKTPKRQCALVQ